MGRLAELLERSQQDLFWVPDDAAVVDRPELLYVACGRDLTFLNCATRVDVQSPRLDELVEEVSAAHRGVRSRWLVPSRLQGSALPPALGRAGYGEHQHHDARGIDVDAYSPRADPGGRVVRVASRSALRECIEVNEEAFGPSRTVTDAELEGELRRCRAADGRVHRFVAYDADGPVCSGGLTVFDALGFGLLWGGGTAPRARGRGFYSAVLAARIEWARRRGLRMVGLYAVTSTSSPIVAAQGFARDGGMTYWQRPPRVRPRARRALHDGAGLADGSVDGEALE